MKNILSVFPQGIDTRVFFSDISLEYVDLMKEYQKLIQSSKYSEASKLLNNSDASFYGAWIFNLLDVRLQKIGEYLLSLEEPTSLIYQEEEPSEGLTESVSWIGV